MLLNDRSIKQYRESGHIVIEPFNEEQLNNVSYDLSLGENFAFHSGVVSFKDLKDHNESFSLEQHDISGGWEIVRVSDGIILHQGQRCLGHSREFAGGTYIESQGFTAVTSYLQCTSTAARLGLTACLCAGWGDVGYINRWTFEICNLSPRSLFIPVRGIIAQLCFETVDVPEKIYGMHQGAYQSGNNLKELQRKWTPTMMLPKGLKVVV